MTAPATPTGRATPRRGISFDNKLEVHETWHSAEYDRRGEPATCNRLTAQLAQMIKEELNAFKMQEMVVHEVRSRHFLSTHPLPLWLLWLLFLFLCGADFLYRIVGFIPISFKIWSSVSLLFFLFYFLFLLCCMWIGPKSKKPCILIGLWYFACILEISILCFSRKQKVIGFAKSGGVRNGVMCRKEASAGNRSSLEKLWR